MPRPTQTSRPVAGRCEFLRGVSLAASLPALGLAAPGPVRADSDAAGRSSARTLDGLDPKNLVHQVKARNLDAVSDEELFRQAAAIVSRPSADNEPGGFVLHAPLELMARYGLLRLVSPSERELARLQMIATAAVYGSGVRLPLPRRVKRFPDLNVARAELGARSPRRMPTGWRPSCSRLPISSAPRASFRC